MKRTGTDNDVIRGAVILKFPHLTALGKDKDVIPEYVPVIETDIAFEAVTFVNIGAIVGEHPNINAFGADIVVSNGA